MANEKVNSWLSIFQIYLLKKNSISILFSFDFFTFVRFFLLFDILGLFAGYCILFLFHKIPYLMYTYINDLKNLVLVYIIYYCFLVLFSKILQLSVSIKKLLKILMVLVYFTPVIFILRFIISSLIVDIVIILYLSFVFLCLLSEELNCKKRELILYLFISCFCLIFTITIIVTKTLLFSL